MKHTERETEVLVRHWLDYMQSTCQSFSLDKINFNLLIYKDLLFRFKLRIIQFDRSLTSKNGHFDF